MIIDVKGKVVAITRETLKSGKSKTLVVVEYPEGEKFGRIACEFFDRDETKCAGVREGAQVVIKCRLSSREWQGRWFTGASGLLVETGAVTQSAQGAADLGDLPF